MTTHHTAPTAASSAVIVLGRDAVGVIAESDGMRYYLTDCCGASAKGCEDYIGCCACYREVHPALGDAPDKRVVYDEPAQGADRIRLVSRPVDFVEVYGDGITYDAWKATR